MEDFRDNAIRIDLFNNNVCVLKKMSLALFFFKNLRLSLRKWTQRPQTALPHEPKTLRGKVVSVHNISGIHTRTLERNHVGWMSKSQNESKSRRDQAQVFSFSNEMKLKLISNALNYLWGIWKRIEVRSPHLSSIRERKLRKNKQFWCVT